jgi:hypothetical protein
MLKKSDVINTWKPEMRSLGFSFREGMFQLSRAAQLPIQFIVAVQRNLHENTFQFNPTIVLVNPLVEASTKEVLLRGKLCKEGIRLHALPSVWWQPIDLDDALLLFKARGISWFEEWGQAPFLSEKLEISIRDNKYFIEVLEPASGETILQELHSSRTVNYVTPTTYYHASVLHYLSGNREKAIARTKDWLNHLGSGQIEQRARAESQLNTLQKLH